MLNGSVPILMRRAGLVRMGACEVMAPECQKNLGRHVRQEHLVTHVSGKMPELKGLRPLPDLTRRRATPQTGLVFGWEDSNLPPDC